VTTAPCPGKCAFWRAQGRRIQLLCTVFTRLRRLVFWHGPPPLDEDTSRRRLGGGGAPAHYRKSRRQWTRPWTQPADAGPGRTTGPGPAVHRSGRRFLILISFRVGLPPPGTARACRRQFKVGPGGFNVPRFESAPDGGRRPGGGGRGAVKHRPASIVFERSV